MRAGDAQPFVAFVKTMKGRGAADKVLIPVLEAAISLLPIEWRYHKPKQGADRYSFTPWVRYPGIGVMRHAEATFTIDGEILDEYCYQRGLVRRWCEEAIAEARHVALDALCQELGIAYDRSNHAG